MGGFTFGDEVIIPDCAGDEEEEHPAKAHDLHTGAPHPGLVDCERGKVVANESHEGVEQSPTYDGEHCGRPTCKGMRQWIHQMFSITSSVFESQSTGCIKD